MNIVFHNCDPMYSIEYKNIKLINNLSETNLQFFANKQKKMEEEIEKLNENIHVLKVIRNIWSIIAFVMFPVPVVCELIAIKLGFLQYLNAALVLFVLLGLSVFGVCLINKILLNKGKTLRKIKLDLADEKEKQAFVDFITSIDVNKIQKISIWNKKNRNLCDHLTISYLDDKNELKYYEFNDCYCGWQKGVYLQDFVPASIKKDTGIKDVENDTFYILLHSYAFMKIAFMYKEPVIQLKTSKYSKPRS